MQQQRHYDYSGVTVAVKKKKKRKILQNIA